MKKIIDHSINIVMYHYVRPIKKSKYPNIKGLEFEDFKEQINFLSKKFNIISHKRFIEIIKSKKIPFILHHMQGTPDTMQKNPKYDDAILDIYDFFEKKINFCIKRNYKKENIIIDFAMRYGNPSIKSKIKKLNEEGCENLVILPLYPQYAAATTATVCDEVYKTLMNMRWQPSLKIIPHYESDPLYVDALVNSINLKISNINWKPDLILASYHGIPKKYFDKGDPYHCYCHKTTRLVSEKFKDIEIKTTFQSRFGPQEWLQPYTDKTLENLPKEGKKNVLTICPGFSSDCVETLEEILIQGKKSFMDSGGENFDMIPCLNDNDDHINLLKNLIQKNI